MSQERSEIRPSSEFDWVAMFNPPFAEYRERSRHNFEKEIAKIEPLEFKEFKTYNEAKTWIRQISLDYRNKLYYACFDQHLNNFFISTQAPNTSGTIVLKETKYFPAAKEAIRHFKKFNHV